MGQQVLDIKDTADIIDGTLIDGNTGVVVLYNTLQHIRERRTEIEIDDILTTGHHLLGGLVAEAHDTFEHILLLLEFVVIRQFQCLLQIINAERMTLLLDNLFCQDSRADQNRG